MTTIEMLERILKGSDPSFKKSPDLEQVINEAYKRISYFKEEERDNDRTPIDLLFNKRFLEELTKEAKETGLTIGTILEREYNRKDLEKKTLKQKDEIIRILLRSLEDDGIKIHELQNKLLVSRAG